MTSSHDEKTLEILRMLEAGKTREEIADHYGNTNWKSVDMYMRRRGFSWEDGQYVIEPPEQVESTVEEATSLHTKAAQIVRMLDVKQPNPRQVAQKQGFESVDEMGKYMKGQGYMWQDELTNYTYDESSSATSSTSTLPSTTTDTIISSNTSTGLTKEHLSLLNALVENQDELLLWLQYSKEGQVPHYKFKGSATQKTLTMTTSSVALLSDFSKEFNISQRIIIEAALAEYLKKYGYAAQVQQATT